MTSLIKNIMMFREPDSIPRQPGWPFKLNPKLPRLDKMNIKVADGITPFMARPRGDGKKKLLLNNFDAAVSLQKPLRRRRFDHANLGVGRQYMHDS